MKRHHLYLLFVFCITCMLLLETGVRIRWTKFFNTSQFYDNLRVTGVPNQKSSSYDHELLEREDETFLPKTLKESKWFEKATNRLVKDSFLRYHHHPNDKKNERLNTLLRNSFNPLELIPVIDTKKEKVLRVLLVTYFRSGSSFLGDLLQQSFRTFYTFEPLHYMTDSTRIGPGREEEAFDLINKIFGCSFPQISHYVRWALKPENRFLFKWNTFLWNTCRMRPSSCFNPNYIQEVCIRSPLHVMKATRIQMSQVKKMLAVFNETTRDELRVVYLVRDPRGMYSSRRNLIWCVNSTCSNPESLCQEMRQDLIDFHELKSQMPNQFFMVKYEDLSLQPMDAALHLFRNLRIPFTSNVSRYLKSHTVIRRKSKDQESEDPYSTRRDSRNVAFEWRKKLSDADIASVQSACSDVIKSLGYEMVITPSLTQEWENVTSSSTTSASND